MWLILAVSGHILNALSFLSDKIFMERVIPDAKALAFVAGLSGILVLPLAIWFPLTGPFAPLAVSFISGIFFILALIFFYNALAIEEVSRVVPAVGGMVPVFTWGLSFLMLGDRLSGRSLLAFLLLVAGGFLIELHSFKDLFSRRFQTSFSLEASAAFLFAASLVFQKYGFTGAEAMTSFMWSRFGTVFAALGILASMPAILARLAPGSFKSISPAYKALAFLSRVSSGVGPLLILAAISMGNVSLINALQGSQFAFLFVLALLLSRKWPTVFGEELKRGVIMRKGAATLVIAAGLALIAL